MNYKWNKINMAFDIFIHTQDDICVCIYTCMYLHRDSRGFTCNPIHNGWLKIKHGLGLWGNNKTFKKIWSYREHILKMIIKWDEDLLNNENNCRKGNHWNYDYLFKWYTIYKHIIQYLFERTGERSHLCPLCTHYFVMSLQSELQKSQPR